MTGKNHMIVMSPDTISVITKVRELRSNSVDAYFSMQTGPSVFINTTEEDEDKVKKAISKMGYRVLSLGGGEGSQAEARLDRSTLNSASESLTYGHWPSASRPSEEYLKELRENKKEKPAAGQGGA